MLRVTWSSVLTAFLCFHNPDVAFANPLSALSDRLHLVGSIVEVAVPAKAKGIVIIKDAKTGITFAVEVGKSFNIDGKFYQLAAVQGQQVFVSDGSGMAAIALDETPGSKQADFDTPIYVDHAIIDVAASEVDDFGDDEHPSASRPKVGMETSAAQQMALNFANQYREAAGLSGESTENP